MAKKLILVGLDESLHSNEMLRWTLRTFFTPPQNSTFRLLIVHASSSRSAGGIISKNAKRLLKDVDQELEFMERRIRQKATEICKPKSVDFEFVFKAGIDAKRTLCAAVEEYRPTMLIVGSHGDDDPKRVVLGRVSEYLAHHAGCPVLVMREPM